MKTNFLKIAFQILLIASIASAANSAPPPGLIHVRGTITSAVFSSLTVSTSTGPVIVDLPPKVGINAVVPSDRKNVKPGSFLGIASVPDSHGAQSAREVVVFPEAARGTGEGSYAWDLPAKSGSPSKMTNGTVSGPVQSKMTNGTVNATDGENVTLKFKNAGTTGQQSIALPQGIPFVTFVPGSSALLVKGAHVFIVGKKLPSGSVAAVRVLVGKNGLVPPM